MVRGMTDTLDEFDSIRDDLVTCADSISDHERWFDADNVRDVLQAASGDFSGELVAVVGNQFGVQLAFRPRETDQKVFDRLCNEVLNKAGHNDGTLEAVESRIVDCDPRIHFAVVAAISEEETRVYFPSDEPAALTKAVGAVHFSTQGYKSSALTHTY